MILGEKREIQKNQKRKFDSMGDLTTLRLLCMGLWKRKKNRDFKGVVVCRSQSWTDSVKALAVGP